MSAHPSLRFYLNANAARVQSSRCCCGAAQGAAAERHAVLLRLLVLSTEGFKEHFLLINPLQLSSSTTSCRKHGGPT